MQETLKILKQKESKANNPRNFIVAVGASAGGLEAIHEFFDNVAGDTGLSFVIIQHLSPDYKSLLVELVGKHTEMNVYEAEDGMPIQQNCVYVIPNKKLITISNGRLKLLDKPHEKAPNTAIDSFLYTLAEEKGREAIAVILSGTGTDGTRGIERIKQAGGMVMVQDPVTAKFDGMPNSAIASENVDYILPPELMPAEIYEYVSIAPEDPYKELQVKESLLTDTFTLIHHCTGWDFNFYKRPTIFRRISRRMVAGGFKTLEEYVEYLRRTPEECQELSKDFLIGVTRFFRDKPAYEVLRKDVFPELIKSKASGDFIKIWITACSTGEEAYSIAILLDDYLHRVDKILHVKIFATDIDQKAIETAGRGIYSEEIANDIEPELLNKYFVKEGNKYAVIPQLRKQIVFASHNLLKDPPFIKNDFISCRNMLIYMDGSLQQKVLNTFHFSLNNNGYLFLGSSETAASLKGKMEEINSRWKIFKKWEGEKSSDYNYSYSPAYADRGTSTSDKIQKKQVKKQAPKSLTDDFNEVMSEDLGYAAIYVDANYEIKEAVGNFRKYLSLPDKLLNLNVLKMVPKDVSALLSTALRKSLKESRKVSLKNIKLVDNGTKRFIDVLIKPPSDSSANYLLVFGETIEKLADDTELVRHENFDHYEESILVSELEAELKETKVNLQTAIEELETTNEELQSSNEELLSANEELQSSNEELQSLNEELHTLNTEHQLKIRELIELNNDLDNYFRTTDIGQIFLDENLHIRKFNSAAVRMINLIESDVGRPIDHISTNIRHQNLLSDIQSVVYNQQIIEKEISLSTGAMCLLRITPYLQQDKKAKGIVVTFIDISTLKDLDNIISGVFNSSVNAIMALKAVRNVSQEIIDFRLIAANYAAETLLRNKGLADKLLKKEFEEFTGDGNFDKLVKVVESNKALHTEYCQVHDGQETFYDVVAVKMMDGLVITFADVTEKKEAENRLRRNYGELNITKEKLRKLNNELETVIKARTKELSESEERFRLVSRATNDAIWDWNLSNNEVWWSESFKKLFGYNGLDEANKRQFWLSKIHEADRQNVKDSLHDVINNSGDSWTCDYRILKSDGNYANILDRGFLLKDEYGTPYRMVGSMMDVTRLRTAEKEVEYNIDQRRFLAESIPLIVWTASPTGKLNFLNTHFSSYTGLSTREALGLGWQKVFNKDDHNNLEQVFKNAVNKKQDFAIEIRVKRYDSTYRWHLLRGRAKKDEKDNLLMWVGTLSEIHEQKLANQILEKKVAERTTELQNAIRELEISNGNLQQFAYIASHDLKEPLRKIHMFSSEIKSRFLAEAGKTANDYIDKVIKSTIRLTKLINDLLTFSTISSNNYFQVTSLQKVLAEVLSDLELIINEKQVIIKADALPAIEVVPSQIRQVLQNLISNAVKFSKKETQPIIKITSERISEKNFAAEPAANGRFVRISISDNGIGFSEQHIDKIFLIFQRLHAKNEFEGTGIGLAITKSIIDKHQGLITARSKEGEGSTFIIILPAAQHEQPATT